VRILQRRLVSGHETVIGFPGSSIDETGASFVIFDQGPSASLIAAGGDSAEKLGLLAGTRMIGHSAVAPGPDPATYAFVKA
jgi:hypothetical protein